MCSRCCFCWWPRIVISWWRHHSALVALCEGNPLVTGGLPSQRPVTQSFDAFFDVRPGKRLSKRWSCWWLETPWCSLWRHCNVLAWYLMRYYIKSPSCRRFPMHFLDSFLNILIQVSLKINPNGPTGNKSSLVQVMARHQMDYDLLH